MGAECSNRKAMDAPRREGRAWMLCEILCVSAGVRMRKGTIIHVESVDHWNPRLEISSREWAGIMKDPILCRCDGVEEPRQVREPQMEHSSTHDARNLQHPAEWFCRTWQM